MRTFTIIRVVRIGNTESKGKRFRFYTDQGSINSTCDAPYWSAVTLEDLLTLEGKTVQAVMNKTTIRSII